MNPNYEANNSEEESQNVQIYDASENENFDDETEPENYESDDEIENSNVQEDDGTDFDPSHFFELSDPDSVNIRRFNTEGRNYSLQFQNFNQLTDLNNQLVPIFQKIIDQVSEGVDDNALMGFSFGHPDLKKGQILIPFRPKKDLTGELVLNTVNAVLQSNDQIQIDSRDASIRLVTVTVPQGSGLHNAHQYMTHNDFLKDKKCIIQIKNDDNLCFARALVVARAHVHKDDPNPVHKWRSIRQCTKKSTLQTKVSRELMVQAGLADFKGACGFNEWPKFQAILPNYQIKIFSKERYKDLLYKGPEAEHILNIYHHDNHYSVITKMPAFFDRSYYCPHCDAAYNDRIEHRCKSKCPLCYNSPPCPQFYARKCKDCNRFFKSDDCFYRHKKAFIPKGENNIKRQKTATSICDRIKVCEKCDILCQRAHLKEHKCGYFECRTCKKDVLKENHQCYMQPEANEENEMDVECDEPIDNEATLDKPELPTRFIFYDFETTQEKILRQTEQGDVVEHEPNLCISHTVCDQCRHNETGHCNFCGDRERIFKGETCLDDFCAYLFGKGMKNITAIAHNSRGFDGHFIMQFLYRKGHHKVDIINKGLELMCIKVGSIKFIDSLNFLPMPLAALPKTFGITELCKGYFPHFFNRKENYGYKGSYPSPDMYGHNAMKPDARSAFLEWYNQQLNGDAIFDFDKELIEYCKSDVHVLRQCCMKFRDIFMEETNVDPFEKSITIASACNLVFRRLFLKPDTIGIIPYKGYGKEERQSIIALKWLKWYSHTHNNQYIRHKLNGGEVQIGQYKVDGISGKTIYEFHGCYWHGCQTCMPRRSRLTADGFTKASDAYERTFKRKMDLEARGYNVVEMWECELLRQLHSNPEMKEFFDSVQIIEPINPRDAFFGGRTNAVKLYHKCKPNEKISYVDICSLYPYINKYGKYPMGHPKIITEGFKTVDNHHHPYEGLMKCTILPPRKLLHPVIPYRHGGKLLFPLCKTCTHNSQNTFCEHNDQERALDGTWVTVELYKALEKGYKISKIYEVWHYDEVEQYDPVKNPDGGLFSQYVNTFMKMKLESEGYPSQAQTDDQKRDYINEVYERENILLDPAKIFKNPGKRALAKLMLNSFWGKFGQRNNMDKTTILNNPKEFFELVNDPANIVKAINMINEWMISLTYHQHDDFAEVMGNTNSVIAAYTTAQARLKLYSYIERLNSRVLYFDTDSIIYLSTTDKHQYQVPTGWCLGEMTNELREYGEDAYISEFVSGGPKNYAFRIYSPSTDQYHHVIKVRGITLSSETMRKVNFHSLRRLVFAFVHNRDHEDINITRSCIERQKDRKIITRKLTKNYRIVYDKRILMRNFCTFPFGWCL